MIKQAPIPVRIPADCHHPGYQSLGSRSWWCDDCLKQCGRAQTRKHEKNPGPHHSIIGVLSAEWQLFWDWFKPAAVAIVGGILSALFVLITYYLQNPIWNEDILATKEAQYKWLTVRRERLLYGIDDVKDQLGKAYFYGHRQDVYELEKSLHLLNRDLDETTDKLKSIEEESWKLEQENIGTKNEDFCLRPEADISRSYNASLYWGSSQKSEQA